MDSMEWMEVQSIKGKQKNYWECAVSLGLSYCYCCWMCGFTFVVVFFRLFIEFVFVRSITFRYCNILSIFFSVLSYTSRNAENQINTREKKSQAINKRIRIHRHDSSCICAFSRSRFKLYVCRTMLKLQFLPVPSSFFVFFLPFYISFLWIWWRLSDKIK